MLAAENLASSSPSLQLVFDSVDISTFPKEKAFSRVYFDDPFGNSNCAKKQIHVAIFEAFEVLRTFRIAIRISSIVNGSVY